MTNNTIILRSITINHTHLRPGIILVNYQYHISDALAMWLIISEVLWHSTEGNFTGNSQDTNPWYEFENYQF